MKIENLEITKYGVKVILNELDVIEEVHVALIFSTQELEKLKDSLPEVYNQIKEVIVQKDMHFAATSVKH